MYKVVIMFPDGETEELDEVFETCEEADAFGVEWVSNYRAGGEVLHLSNPGDYPLEDGDADFEVIED